MIHTGSERLLTMYFDEYKDRAWSRYYAWKPVRDIYGKWHWRKTMYRLCGNTYSDYDSWTWYFYLDEHDYMIWVLRRGIKTLSQS
jgi:hypothetical protein